MGDNVAILEGYTREVVASANGSESIELFLLVKPDTDFDGSFRAWDTDAQEFINVNGWMFAVTGVDEQTYPEPDVDIDDDGYEPDGCYECGSHQHNSLDHRY